MTTDERHEHDALDRRLRETFEPPADVDAIARRALERATVGAVRPTAARSFALNRLAVAAALLVGALGLLWWATGGAGRDAPGVPGVPGAPLVLAEAIDALDALDAAFPSCTNEAQFAQMFDERYGQELHVGIDTARPVSGPFTCGSWPSATLMTGLPGLPADSPLPPLAPLEQPVAPPEQPVALLVDTLDADPRLVSDAQAGVFVHRRVIGRLVVYELSREAEPAWLDLFFTPSD
jgi:hypothetical protein